MAGTLTIVKLLTNKISYAARVLRKCIWRLYKHCFQRRDPRGLWCDWQPMWLQSGRNTKDNVQRRVFINYMVGPGVACVSFRRICTYTDNLLLKSPQKKDIPRKSLAIWCISYKKVMTVLHIQVIRFICVCVCVVTVPAHHLAQWWISFGNCRTCNHFLEIRRKEMNT